MIFDFRRDLEPRFVGRWNEFAGLNGILMAVVGNVACSTGIADHPDSTTLSTPNRDAGVHFIGCVESKELLVSGEKEIMCRDSRLTSTCHLAPCLSNPRMLS